MSNNQKMILSVPIDTFGLDSILSRIEKGLELPGIKTIFAVNPEKIIKAQENSILLDALKDADFLIPDGIGTTIAIRVLYGEKAVRITGIMLMSRLLEFAEKTGLRVFIFGSQPDVNNTALSNLKKEFPLLNFVGTQHGYLPEDEFEPLVKDINNLGTDILFVGLGSPKQEEWIYNNKKNLKVKICMGIGGSLDVIAGRIKRAPMLIQNVGLEWFYRLIKEPSRFKRQKVLPRYAYELIREKLFSR